MPLHSNVPRYARSHRPRLSYNKNHIEQSTETLFVPEVSSETVPDVVPEVVSEAVPEDIIETVPEDIQESTPETESENVPEDVPEIINNNE